MIKINGKWKHTEEEKRKISVNDELNQRDKERQNIIEEKLKCKFVRVRDSKTYEIPVTALLNNLNPTITSEK